MKDLDITKMQQRVLLAIQDTPNAANDDALLLSVIWGQDWDYNQTLYQNLKRLPRSESITRRRRELQNLGLIELSEKREKEVMHAMKNEIESHVAVSWLED